MSQRDQIAKVVLVSWDPVSSVLGVALINNFIALHQMLCIISEIVHVMADTGGVHLGVRYSIRFVFELKWSLYNVLIYTLQ